MTGRLGDKELDQAARDAMKREADLVNRDLDKQEK